MDDQRFDTLTSTFAGAHSRRGALAAVFGGTLGLLGRTATSAKHKQHKKKHHRPVSSPPPPPPPAPVVCPPVCPICQGCNAATGLCFAHPSQQGLAAPGCAAPQVCCSGACCDPIHACNASGTCATCAEVCAPTCALCVYLADGSTVCGHLSSSNCVSPCTTNADCVGGAVCVIGVTLRSTNQTLGICNKPLGNGFCTTITPCP